MSRSGYDDGLDGWDSIRYRGRVANTVKGRKSQEFLREMLAVLNAMPEKRLIMEELQSDGEVCAMGAVGRTRGLDMSMVDPEKSEEVAGLLGISRTLAREVAYINDQGCYSWEEETPERRHTRVRAWVKDQIIPPRP